MAEDYSQEQFFTELGTRLKDMEEKQRLINERTLLLGKTLVDGREKNFSEMQDMKKMLLELKKDSDNMKRILLRMTEQFTNVAQKEELMTLQRQFDLFREK